MTAAEEAPAQLTLTGEHFVKLGSTLPTVQLGTLSLTPTAATG